MAAATEINFQELFEKLPQDLRVILGSENTATAMDLISKKYQLGLGKEGILSEETGLVLLGVLHPKDFISQLSEKLRIDKETAKKIAEDVNREIFQKVRVSLRKLYGITDEVEVKPPEIIIKEAPKPVPKAPSPPPAPPPIPKPQPAPPKIIIKENIEIPKEAPREELKPLEIRPIKGGPLGEENGIKEAQKSEKISPRPQLDFPPRRSDDPEHDMGLKVMPHSLGEVGIKKEAPKPPSPPAGMAFIAEKKLEPPKPATPPSPPKPSYDQYRERI